MDLSKQLVYTIDVGGGVRPMGSLADAYDRQVGDGDGRTGRGRSSESADRTDADTDGRPYLGVGSLAVATVLLGGAVVLATSNTAAAVAGLSAVAAAELARVLAGLGLPLVFIGVLAIVPSTRRANRLALLGVLLAIGGLAAFLWAYPDRWLGDALDLTVPVTSLYVVGLLLTFLALVYGVLGAGRERSENEAGTGSGRRGSRTSLR
jgi:hypothetical protein